MQNKKRHPAECRFYPSTRDKTRSTSLRRYDPDQVIKVVLTCTSQPFGSLCLILSLLSLTLYCKNARTLYDNLKKSMAYAG